MIKTTYNKKQVESIYKGEDKTIRAYFYDSVDFEFYDLANFLSGTVCLKDTDDNEVSVVLSNIGVDGSVEIELNEAVTATLKAGKQVPVFKFVDALSKITIVIGSGYLEIIDPEC